MLTGVRRSEHGQVAVFVGLLLPVLFALAAVVLDVGNWYIHKRHLQTQVDAAALAPAPEFTGCFDPLAWDATNDAIAAHALGFAGDTLRPGTLGSSTSATTNRQIQQPDDVRITLNANRYWSPSDGYTPATPTDGYTDLDYTLDEEPSGLPDGDGGFCSEGYIDVKATDEDAPLLWGLIPLTPSPKSHARAQIFDQSVSDGILPFAVPEVVPGSVYALFVDESKPAASAVISRARLCGTPCEPDPTPDPALSDYAVYEGSNGSQPIGFTTGLDNIGVIILVSRSDVTAPDVGSNSITTICAQTGVRCYSGGGPTDGLALIDGHETGSGPGPIARQVSVGGCSGPPNLSGPYFTVTGECVVSISAEIDFSGFANPQARTHLSANCGGSGTGMTLSGGIWSSLETLPEPSKDVGQVPMSISWRATGSGGWNCLDTDGVARPYVANKKAGPVLYLKLTATDSGLNPVANAYSPPNDPLLQPLTYTVTAGLLPPLLSQTLSDKAVLIRFASEDGGDGTQSIDCDVDSYPYPDPYDSVPAAVAEIGYGCVTPYKENPTLDCSAYDFADLPPAPPPTTTFDNAPDCAESVNGTVQSLQKGLAMRVGEPPDCAPNNWPDPPITPAKLTNFITNFGDDPRLVTLVVTEFGAFDSPGNKIVPVRYFAGFYITGKDVSNLSPRCPDEDPHPLYGTGYLSKPNPTIDNGDVWGYFITRVEYSSGGFGEEECDFTGAPENCVLSLVE